jgi:pSer/pThr/pTyr-binding forkhead associated (FHA) protein
MPEIIVKLGDTIVQRYHFEGDKEVISIGRARDNDIIVENLSVSRNHARIRFQDQKYVLTDLNSANGSFVNGVKVSKTELTDEDIISIGKHKLHFLDKDGASATGSASSPIDEVDQIDSAPEPVGASAGDAGEGPGVLAVTRGKQTNQIFRLKPGENSIGRALENDIRLHDWFVSKNHAVIVWSEGHFVLRDMGSWRGTTINGAPAREAKLKDNDEIVFGTTVVQFRSGKQAEALLASPTMLPPEESDRLERLPEFPERGQPEEGDDMESFDSAPTSDSIPVVEALPVPTAPEPAPPGEDEFEAFDDEFAPLTDDELAALEAEDAGEMEVDPELAAQAEWEQLEAEKMMEDGGGWKKTAKAPLIEDDEAQERDAAPMARNEVHTDMLLDEPELSGEDEEAIDNEEEESLFRGEIPTAEPGNLPEVFEDEDGGAPAAQSAPVAASPSPAKVSVAAPVALNEEMETPAGVDPKEFRKWSRGLRNRSKIIRREAARRLKELTGNEYDWESEPE